MAAEPVVKVPEAAPPPKTGVVLAAGRSERLSMLTKGRSKALVQLGGVPLVERAVHTLLTAGCERVIVVVGYQAEEVTAAARLAPGVEVVRAEGWEAGNGASIAAAEQALDGEDLFVLLCGDHTFASGALDPLVRTGEPAVLIDESPDRAAWAEGTRVHVRGTTAMAFGKSLEDPGIDCGVFVLPRGVFAAHRSAARDGDHSLAGAVTRLAQDRPIQAVPLPAGSWWQDVDTPDDLRAAKARVRRSLIKPSDGPVSRYLNRPISTRITMAIAPFRLSPNLLSFFTFLIGIWAGWSLSAGRAVVGGLLVQTASVLDGVDGETARLQGRASARGAFLDGLFDRMVDAAIVAGLWLWWWDNPGRPFRILIILASSIGWGAVTVAIKKWVSVYEREKDREPTLHALVGGRDARMLIIATGAVVNQPLIAVIVAGTTYCWPGMWRVLSFRKRPKGDAPARPPTPDQVGDSTHRDLKEIG